MSISAMYFMKNFAFTDSGNDYLIRTAQAADGQEMSRVYLNILDEIAAINAAIVAAGPTPEEALQRIFTPVDATLAGSGDGHTFMFTVTLARVKLAAVQQMFLGQQVFPASNTAPPFGVPGPIGFDGLPVPQSADNPTIDAGATPIGMMPLVPQLFFTGFDVASSQAEVQAAQNRLVDSIMASISAAVAASVLPAGFFLEDAIFCPFWGVAGGAKGQRFMVAMTGVPVVAPSQQLGLMARLADATKSGDGKATLDQLVSMTGGRQYAAARAKGR